LILTTFGQQRSPPGYQDHLATSSLAAAHLQPIVAQHLESQQDGKIRDKVIQGQYGHWYDSDDYDYGFGGTKLNRGRFVEDRHRNLYDWQGEPVRWENPDKEDDEEDFYGVNAMSDYSSYRYGSLDDRSWPNAYPDDFTDYIGEPRYSTYSRHVEDDNYGEEDPPALEGDENKASLYFDGHGERQQSLEPTDIQLAQD